jgi:hypothetical protein
MDRAARGVLREMIDEEAIVQHALRCLKFTSQS